MKNDLISISDYAKIKGISKQAVYKQLKNKLKEFVVEVENHKALKESVLSASELEKLKKVESEVEQPENNQIQPFWQSQIEEKDKQIHALLEQIEKLQKQNGELTELLRGSQVLLAQEKTEKQMYLEEETATRKEKRGFFSIFKRKKDNT